MAQGSSPSSSTSRRMPSAEELLAMENRLREAEQTLAAIRSGEVDSLVVDGADGPQVFSLQGAEQPYRLLVEQMQQGAITMTPDGVILYANRRMADLLEMPLHHVIGTRVTNFIDPSEHGMLLAALQSPAGQKMELVMNGGETKSISVPVSIALSPLPMDDSAAVCAVVTDLTEDERKRELLAALARLTEMQGQLRVQNDELHLARRVAETAQHTAEELQRVAEEAQRVAESASDAKDEFLATLSHELRTPLTPVLVAAQSLESEMGLPTHVQGDLAMIRRNVELEARLIDDLLDLTRIVRGKVELRMSDIDLRKIATNVVEICAGDLSDARIRLEQDLGDEPVVVRGDAVRVQQILWNLVRNAIKFTPPEGRVTLTLQAISRDGVMVANVMVTDTGIGMNADTISRIFSPFEQAGREITRRFGGLGLGLAISRKLAELQHGTITAESAGPGMGSVFRLELPLPAARLAAIPKAATLEDRPTTRRLKIVLVEDHEDTRRSMTRILSMEHDVRAAGSVAAALETAGQGPFDLIISDLGLPDGSGFELMAEIRRRHGEDVKGICLSGYGMDADVANSKKAGFNRHLTKPVSLASLKAAIAEAVPT